MLTFWLGVYHMLAGALLATAPETTRITSFALLADFVSAEWLVVLGAGIAAIAAQWAPPGWKYVLGWPQQALLLLASLSAVIATSLGRYPDGYETSPLFILLDQSIYVVVAVAHYVELQRSS